MKVSVVITTRNRSMLLRQAIDSAIRQEPCGADVEIIVVDDDSTDNSRDVVARYPSVLYVHTKQGTCGGSRNVGISHAKGDWIAFLDDDDVWLPHKLKVCLTIIESKTDVRFVFSAATICDYQLHPGAVWSGPDLQGTASPYDAFLDALPSPSTVMLRRDIFEEVGLFETYAPRAEDRDMWFRILSRDIACASTPESLVLYRLREKENGQLTYDSYVDTMRVLRRYFGGATARRPSWPRRQQVIWRVRGWYAHLLIEAARRAEQEGQPAEAGRLRRLAVCVSPLHSLKNWLVETS